MLRFLLAIVAVASPVPSALLFNQHIIHASANLNSAFPQQTLRRNQLYAR